MKIAMVTVLGRPNVGKSTLMNKILNYDVSIVSNVPQTTRDQITGIYNEEDYQIVFIDTPGIHKPLNLLGEILNKNAYDSLEEIDCVLFLTPLNEDLGAGDLAILEKLKVVQNKIAVITKVDLAKTPDEISTKLAQLQQTGFNFTKIIPFSNKKQEFADDLIKVLKEFTYEGQPLYDPEYITDKSMRFLAKEIIREAAFNYLKEELPHSIAIEVEDFIEDDELTQINAIIYVKKDSQKGMVIGKEGQMIKKIGMMARRKLMALFSVKVELNLKVKVAKKWTQDVKLLKKFGY
ncbi:GTPase Era [Mycoplasmopsis columbinasalis]|uniref:GTPase Era n=1 Tax=Mycoplasmopsis columbinasalis TaxID=114880 RepID=A0A449BA23_9BACT|nr:GTPase Era [Mycoplasmopsis columbinasalis]VEU78024.1 GTP-binding protein [Mycoplasmopsis columbinasalis]